MLCYQLKGKRFRYWTKLKVKQNEWGNQKVKQNFIGAAQINSILADLVNTINEIERGAIFNKKN